MDDSLRTLTSVIVEANGRLRVGSHAATRVWPTGFSVLDKHLNGGFRSGELVLLGGPAGIGKTTWFLQVARNVARAGRPVVYFAFEHDPQTLLIRLVSMESGELGGVEAPSLNRIRASFEAADGRSGSVVDRLQDTSVGVCAVESVQKYADRLIVHRSTGSTTSVQSIKNAVEQVRQETGQLPLVIVDYLQKVQVDGPTLPTEQRVTTVVESLKDLALDTDGPVLAVVAAHRAGPTTGNRMGINDLHGSSSLAYEADVVLMLNDKFDVVARHHLMYNLGNAERFKQWAVLSIEKNRNGRHDVDLEFQKRFAQGRFEPSGQLVAEQLVDDRVFVE